MVSNLSYPERKQKSFCELNAKVFDFLSLFSSAVILFEWNLKTFREKNPLFSLKKNNINFSFSIARVIYLKFDRIACNFQRWMNPVNNITFFPVFFRVETFIRRITKQVSFIFFLNSTRIEVCQWRRALSPALFKNFLYTTRELWRAWEKSFFYFIYNRIHITWMGWKRRRGFITHLSAEGNFVGGVVRSPGSVSIASSAITRARERGKHKRNSKGAIVRYSCVYDIIKPRC